MRNEELYREESREIVRRGRKDKNTENHLFSSGVGRGSPAIHPDAAHTQMLDGALSLTKSLGYVDINPDPNAHHVTPVEESDDTSWQGYDRRRDRPIRRASRTGVRTVRRTLSHRVLRWWCDRRRARGGRSLISSWRSCRRITPPDPNFPDWCANCSANALPDSSRPARCQYGGLSHRQQ